MMKDTKEFLFLGKSHMLELMIKGLFWLAPIIAITIIIIWIYHKMNALTGFLFEIFGFNPESYPILWTIVGLILLAFFAYVIGFFVETRLGHLIQRIYSKIPGYSTIKELINIFNTSKSGEQKVLVVLIRGFANEGYNIGLMYSTKESILKEHYTVTLSMTPIPNGGYMFEVHQDNIHVIKEATFDTNLQYLLSMGVKSMPEILKIEAKGIEEFPTIKSFLEKK